MTTTVACDAYDAATLQLAQWHSSQDFGALLIYSFDDPHRETVRLLEVSPDFPYKGEIVPVTFGSSDRFPFRSTVIQVNCTEWEKVLAGGLPLPDGWDLGNKRQVWPE